MGRPRKWPPTIHTRNSREMIRVNGTDYQLGPAGSEEARTEYARLVRELSEAGAPPKKKGWPTIDELIVAWETKCVPKTSEKETKHRRAALQVLRSSGRGKLTTDRVTLATLKEVRQEMLARESRHQIKGDRRDGQTWSRNYVNSEIRRLRTVWRWAEEEGLAPPGSWAHLRVLKQLPAHDQSLRHTDRTQPATQEDVDAILRHVRAPAARAMLQLQWLTGMRSGEVRTMRACEVDTTGPVWLYRPRAHKNSWRGHDRVVAIGPQGQEILRPLLERSSGERHVFLTRRGTPYTSPVYGRIGKRAGKVAGLPWFRCYALRHGFRVRMTKEMGLDVTRAMMGHKSIQTTEQYGTQVDIQQAIKAAEKLG